MALQQAASMDAPSQVRFGVRKMSSGNADLFESGGVFSEESWRLELARKGNREALQRLLDPLRPKLEAFFARRVKDLDEAENLTQQTLLQVFQRLADFRNECPFDRWVWCIAGNLAVQHYRNRSRSEAFTVEFPDDNLPAVGNEEFDIHLSQWVKELLTAADHACSKIELTVLLMYYQVGSFDKVAELLELNAATVRSRFFRGRAALLSYLIRFRPDAIGGRQLILSCAKKLAEASNGEELNPSEYDALVQGRYPSKAHRSAALKVARLLPNPFHGK